MENTLNQELAVLSEKLAGYSVRQLADISGAGASTVYNLLKKGKMPQNKFKTIYENICGYFSEDQEIITILNNIKELQNKQNKE